MKKSKSTLVTIIIAVMLVVIDAGLYMIYMPGFMILSGVLAAYGYLRGAADFHHWLCKEPPLTPADLTETTGKLFDLGKEEQGWNCRHSFSPVVYEEDTANPLAESQLLDAIIEELRESPAET